MGRLSMNGIEGRISGQAMLVIKGGNGRSRDENGGFHAKFIDGDMSSAMFDYRRLKGIIVQKKHAIYQDVSSTLTMAPYSFTFPAVARVSAPPVPLPLLLGIPSQR